MTINFQDGLCHGCVKIQKQVYLPLGILWDHSKQLQLKLNIVNYLKKLYQDPVFLKPGRVVTIVCHLLSFTSSGVIYIILSLTWLKGNRKMWEEQHDVGLVEEVFHRTQRNSLSESIRNHHFQAPIRVRTDRPKPYSVTWYPWGLAGASVR